MTKQELEEKIKELEKQIAELKNAKVEEKVWKPENGEKYWFVNNWGETNDTFWGDDTKDNFAYEQGNCFKTEEEAEEHLKRLTIQRKFRTYIRAHSDELDWNNLEQEKYAYVYDFDCCKIEVVFGLKIKQQGTIYASSKQILKDAIKYIGGEEVAKKYLFD